MKAFIYSKSTSENIETLDRVEAVQKDQDNQLIFITEGGEAFSCDTKKYKIVIYQN